MPEWRDDEDQELTRRVVAMVANRLDAHREAVAKRSESAS